MYMIDEGLGVGMQPKLILDLCAVSHPNLVTRPLQPRETRQLGLAVKAMDGCPLAVRRFIACVKETFPKK